MPVAHAPERPRAPSVIACPATPPGPFHLALAVTVPVVDLDRVDGRWNKPLAMINSLLMPLWFVASTGWWQAPVPSESFPMWALTLSIGAGLALLVLVTSKADRPPGYQTVRVATAAPRNAAPERAERRSLTPLCRDAPPDCSRR